MQKKFMCMSLIIFVIGIASVNAAEKEIQEEIRIGQSVYSCRGSDFMYQRDSTRKTLTISLSNKAIVAQISDSGMLTVTGNEQKGRLFVCDSLNKIRLDTKEQSQDNESPDRRKKTILLQTGNSINFNSFFDVTHSLSVNYSHSPVSSSPRSHSQLNLAAIHDNDDEKNRTGKVFLSATEEEPRLLNNFLQFDQEKRKQLLAKLPIDQHTKLLIDLDNDYYINHFDNAMQLLKQKIGNSLEQGISQDVSSWSTAIGWFTKINTWSSKTQKIINQILEKTIPKVLFEWRNAADEIKEIFFCSAGTRVIVWYRDNKMEIIDLESKKVIFRKENIKELHSNLSGTKIVIWYRDSKMEIIDLEVKNISEKSIFHKNDVTDLNLNRMCTELTVEYENGEVEIIDLEKRDEEKKDSLEEDIIDLEIESKMKKTSFQDNNIKEIIFNLTETRAITWYKDSRVKIIDLEDYDRDIIFTKLKPKELLFIYSLNNLDYSDSASLTKYDSLWKSLSFDLRRKLNESYLSQTAKKHFKRERTEIVIGRILKGKKIVTLVSAAIFFASIIFIYFPFQKSVR